MKLSLSQSAHRRLFGYARATNGEISGLGSVWVISPHHLHLDEVYLLEQEASLSETTLKPEAIAEFLSECREPQHIRLWWHSHGSMDAFWSRTDEGTISSFARLTDWMVSVVVNRKGSYLARFDLFKPIRATMNGLEIVEDAEHELDPELVKEVKEKVSVPSLAELGNLPLRGDVGEIYQDEDSRCWRCGKELRDEFQLVCRNCGAAQFEDPENLYYGYGGY